MEFYNLGEEEYVLYKGTGKLKNYKGEVLIVLTNVNFVFITTEKKLFTKDNVETRVYPVSELKIYNSIPQIIRKGNDITIYLKYNEVEFTMEEKSEIRHFMNAALKLVTSKTAFERGVDKVKAGVEIVEKSTGLKASTVAGFIASGGLKKTAGVAINGTKFFEKVIKKR